MCMGMNANVTINAIVGKERVHNDRFGTNRIKRIHMNIGVNVGYNYKQVSYIRTVTTNVNFSGYTHLLHGRCRANLRVPTRGKRQIVIDRIFTLDRGNSPLYAILIRGTTRTLTGLVVGLMHIVSPSAIILNKNVITSKCVRRGVLRGLRPAAVHFIDGKIIVAGLGPKFVKLLKTNTITVGV